MAAALLLLTVSEFCGKVFAESADSKTPLSDEALVGPLDCVLVVSPD